MLTLIMIKYKHIYNIIVIVVVFSQIKNNSRLEVNKIQPTHNERRCVEYVCCH